jgi:hypothetical protein
MAINSGKKRNSRCWKKWNDAGSVEAILKPKKEAPSNKDFLLKAILIAKEKAFREGIAIGEIIAHPKDNFSYKLEEIKGSIAIASRPNPEGEGRIVKEFLFHEIFDLNLTLKIAKELSFQHKQEIINIVSDGSAGMMVLNL